MGGAVHVWFKAQHKPAVLLRPRLAPTPVPPSHPTPAPACRFACRQLRAAAAAAGAAAGAARPGRGRVSARQPPAAALSSPIRGPLRHVGLRTRGAALTRHCMRCLRAARLRSAACRGAGGALPNLAAPPLPSPHASRRPNHFILLPFDALRSFCDGPPVSAAGSSVYYRPPPLPPPLLTLRSL